MSSTSRPQRILIVSSRLADGPHLNQAGPHQDYLARLMARQAGLDVTLLCTGSCPPHMQAALVTAYAAMQVRLVFAADLPLGEVPKPGMLVEHLAAYAIYEYCRAHSPDTLVVPETRGLGFVCTQGKRLGLGLSNTRIVAVMHGPAAWYRAGHGFPITEPVVEAKIEYFEHYTLQHADVVVAPSVTMLDWARSQHLPLPDDVRCMPLLCPQDWQASPATPRACDFAHLILFASLETQHGALQFLDILAKTVQTRGNLGLRQVTVLSPDSVAERLRSHPPLAQHLSTLRAARIDVGERCFTSVAEALAFCDQVNGIAVCPAVHDHVPYASLACLVHGVPCLLSGRTALGEYTSGNLFDPRCVADTQRAVAERAACVAATRLRYDRVAADTAWVQLMHEPTSVRVQGMLEWPQLSVCVPFYNHAAFLPATLASLQATQYPNLEVVAVNDGSTDAAANEVFAACETQYAPLGWQFLRQDNAGLGATRNAAVARAHGDILCFMDSDDLALPHMLHHYATSIVQGGVDCVTCYYEAFADDKHRRGDKSGLYQFMPIGPCWRAGVLENVYGGANFCVRADVFGAVGGFTPGRAGCEDWEFLARLVLSGYALDVVPSVLFLYRRGTGNMTTTMSHEASFARGMRPYTYARPEQLEEIFKSSVLPIMHNYTSMFEYCVRIKKAVQQTEHVNRQSQSEIGKLRGEVLRLRKQLAAAAKVMSAAEPTA